MGDGDDDQDDEEPGPVASSTSDATVRDASEACRAFRSVVSVLVRFCEEFLYKLKAGQRAASGRPRPAAGTLATTMPQLRTDNFYRELAERLGPAMPAHVTISHDARFPSLTLAGHSGNFGRLFPTLFIRGPFRFRLRLSAKLILRDVQRFAVLELHQPWPGEQANEPKAADHLPKPRAVLTHDHLRLWYEDGGRALLELAPVPLDRLRR